MELRADAARNHEVILAATARAYADAPDAASVTMDQIADVAGVGKGTLFRRFGDRTGLIKAVFESSATGLCAALEEEAPPLGSTTEPRVRIHAILQTILAIKVANLPLAIALESTGDGALFETDNYRRAHTAIVDSLRLAGFTTEESVAAHALLSATRADLIRHLLEVEHRAPGQISEGLREYVSIFLS